MKQILTLTVNPSIDTSLSAERIAAGQKLRCSLNRHEPGGGGINISRAINILGGQSTAVFASGGLYGTMLEQLLKKEKIPVYPVSVDRQTRENIIALDRSVKHQYRFTLPGPTLNALEWRSILKRIEEFRPRPDYVVASGSLPPGVPTDFYARVARIGKKIKARVIVDTSGQALIQAARAGVYLLKPNVRELQYLTGRSISSEEEQEKTVKQYLRDSGVEIMVVSLGPGGALLGTKRKLRRLHSPSVPVKSMVGAGDSMLAGIVMMLAQGKSIDRAVHYGIAAGSAAVMTPGTELCRKKDVERLFESLTRGSMYHEKKRFINNGR
ncbi:MAG: hexose kinase [Elusimicrobia bacterium]|nr:hexose kinase [Elusimicrobiota bacterium]MBD3411908.1 hexose kinase [Elusimicrobiota bacterium]